jgi:hypothetical protein
VTHMDTITVYACLDTVALHSITRHCRYGIMFEDKRRWWRGSPATACSCSSLTSSTIFSCAFWHARRCKRWARAGRVGTRSSPPLRWSPPSRWRGGGAWPPRYHLVSPACSPCGWLLHWRWRSSRASCVSVSCGVQPAVAVVVSRMGRATCLMVVELRRPRPPES